jgi:hypothetical protein
MLLRPGIAGPTGAVPAYEFDFGDNNPPLLAWAAYKIYNIEDAVYGVKDVEFLQTIFPRLNRYYTWFTLDADVDGHQLLGTSFLGLDNASPINRSDPPSRVKALYQPDGTAWAGKMALDMMKIALELGGMVDGGHEAYDEFAGQFLINAALCALSLNNYEDSLPRPGYNRPNLYNEEDNWFYDAILMDDDKVRQLKVRSLIGIVPVFGVESFCSESFRPDFTRHVSNWMKNEHHRALAGKFMSLGDDDLADIENISPDKLIGIFLVQPNRLRAILKTVLDPEHLYSEFGIRSASKLLQSKPYKFDAGDGEKVYTYNPAESFGDGKMFGGNSGWRGSIWFPTTYIFIESLMKYHEVLGDDWKVELPTGSGNMASLKEVALDIARRLIKIFELRADGSGRPVYGDGKSFYNTNERFSKNVLFYEYFHGCNGSGVGASHQTGWTGLCADLLSRVSAEDACSSKGQQSELEPDIA